MVKEFDEVKDNQDSDEEFYEHYEKDDNNRIIAIVCYDEPLSYFFTNNFVNGKTHINFKPEDIRQIKISIKTRIDVAKDAEENVIPDESEYHEFQSTINYLENLLKRLEAIP